MSELFSEAEFWVAVAFAIFVAFLFYVGTHNVIIEALDKRGARIKTDLEDAARLRDEAAQLLAEFQRQQQDIEREASDIVASAKAEAERLVMEARIKVEEFVARRTKMAETKIGQAEAQALADVRAAIAEAAVAAAGKVLARTPSDQSITRDIENVRLKLGEMGVEAQV